MDRTTLSRFYGNRCENNCYLHIFLLLYTFVGVRSVNGDENDSKRFDLKLKMLSASHKSKRKRRRRKKTAAVPSRSESVTSPRPQSPTATVPDELPPELLQPDQPLFPRLHDDFLREEAEIETAMLLKNFSNESDLAKRKEYEIAFFTSCIEPDDGRQQDADLETGSRDDMMDVLPTPSSVRTTTYRDDGPQLAASYFNDDDKPLIEPMHKLSAYFDESLLFVPDLALMLPKIKDIESADATYHRSYEEEGLFIHAKPDILERNRAQMINRLLEENATHWLDSKNVDLVGLVSFPSDRMLFKSDGGRKIRPILFPVTSVESSSAAFAMQDKTLKIQIHDIVFEQHPSYNAEQSIARRVEFLYQQYVTRRQNDVVANLQVKLDVLRKLVSSTVQNNPDSTRSGSTDDTTHRNHKNELRDLRNRLHREEKTDRDIARNLMQEWKALKELREKQGSNQTSLKLVIKTREIDADEDEHEWNYRFNLELNEIYEEAMESYRDERRQQKAEAKVKVEGGDFEQIQKARRPDMEEVRMQLNDIFASGVRPPGEQLIDFELVKRSGVAELEKLKAATDLTKYVIRLLLDDKEVSAVRTTRMDINGHVHLNELFSIRLVTKIPDNINISVSIIGSFI